MAYRRLGRFARRLLDAPRIAGAAELAGKRLEPWLRGAAARLPRQGVLFLHQGRCGSTVLADLLGQHPRIASYGEIFNEYFDRGHLPTSPELMLLGARLGAPTRHAVVEAKFFECQHLRLVGATPGGLVELAKRCGYRRFIVLDRRNYLAKVISTRVALDRGNRWHLAVSDSAPITTTRLDVERVLIQGKTAPLVELFEYMDAQYRELRAALRAESTLELAYEDDILHDPQAGYAKVCAWLGLPRCPVRVQLRRTNAKPPWEVLANWEEVVRALEGTRYAWMTQSDS